MKRWNNNFHFVEDELFQEPPKAPETPTSPQPGSYSNIPNIAGTLRENGALLLEYAMMLDMVDCFLSDLLPETGRKLSEFLLVKDYFDNFRKSDGEQGSLLFETSPRDYLIYVDCKRHGDKWEISFLLQHLLPHECELYDPVTKQWEKTPYHWIDKLKLTGSFSETCFLEFCGDSGLLRNKKGRVLEETDYDELTKNSKEIIALHQELKGLMNFSLMDNDTIGLIPAEDNIHGIAVKFAEGQYHVLQYCTNQDFRECFESTYGYPLQEAAQKYNFPCEEELNRQEIAFATSDIQKVAAYLRDCLDHYYTELKYIIPVSDKAYVCTWNPMEDLAVILIDRRKQLSEEEKDKIASLARFFFPDMSELDFYIPQILRIL